MKNTLLIQHEVNKTFDEVLQMSDDDFRQWVIDLRKVVVDLWDNQGLPPRVGFTEEDAADQFNKMTIYPTHNFMIDDLLTGEKNVIRNTSVLGNAVNDWFPTMMKTKISYSSKGDPKSIYDYFSDDKLLKTFLTYANRHFKRDSFYHYSAPISYGDIIRIGNNVHTVTTPEAFIEWYSTLQNPDHGYWLCPVKENKKYTGYNPALAKKQNLVVDISFADKVPNECKTNVDATRSNHYSIRLYKKGQKLFPIGLKAFRVSFCQYAVNWPPLTARFIYETFTDHIKDQERIVIYDPSAGWAGRLVGAMAVDSRRNIHYVVTDPNHDHDLPNGRTKYHEVADFFNKHVRLSGKLFGKAHTYEIFQDGSEKIGENPNFQKYKGQVDFIFTSPPYWIKEVYSADTGQSCHSYSQYEDWRENFLRPTLETCVEYLRNQRYLAWNIADVAVDGKMFPLEQDSIDILKSLGMEHVKTLKLALAQMPGGNRLVETDKKETIVKNTVFGEEKTEETVMIGQMKNFCRIQSGNKKIYLKYEPIFIFWKP